MSIRERLLEAIDAQEHLGDKPITELDVSVTRDDGVVALSGHAVCFTAQASAGTESS